jgi:selenocysteine lyase/cysteine desulfurase
VIETRSRQLASHLAKGLQAINGVSLWTSTDPARSGAIVVFKPAGLTPGALVRTLYEKDRIVAAASGGTTRPGVRFSPHFYNTMDEMDRTIAAVKKYIASGLPA